MEIGVDIVDLRRLNIDHQHFIDRVLTDKEKTIFYTKKTDQQKREFLGGRFAAKEAYSKALGTGIGRVGFHDIEVLNDDFGKPYLNIKNAKVSISHEKDYAVAFVMIT